MEKDYIVYYCWEDIEEGDNCNHHFKEFDTIRDAVGFYNTLGTKNKWIVRLVTWKTDITDITGLEKSR